MRRSKVFSAIALPSSLLAACSGGSSPSAPPPFVAPTSTATAPRSTQQIVGISGNRYTLNGVPWLPRSVVIRGFTASPATEATQVDPNAAARANYGASELAAAQGFGADTLRFMVSQPSFDPQSSLYDAQYVHDTEAAIAFARQNGFVVLIAMQDEPPSGETAPQKLATAETVRDWDTLGAVFGTDRGVLFELYNEPQFAASNANWQLWLNGTPNDTAGTGYVGMQTMITHLRAMNCQNVFVLDGLQFAHTLAGVPTVTDPLGRVGYAVHPYLDGSGDESAWDGQFGNPSATLPVFADEWSAQGGAMLGLGSLNTYQPALDLVNYVRAHGIALGGSAFDVPDLMVQSVPGWTPTNYDNFSSSMTQDDAGLLIHADFVANYGRVLTNADAVTP